MGEKRKVRVELRKNRTKPPRTKNWTRGLDEQGLIDIAPTSERVRAKGDLSRHRTIMQDVSDDPTQSGEEVLPSVADKNCLFGRVVRIHGLQSVVETEEGLEYRCAVRRLLKSFVTDERNIVTVGDRVWFRDAGSGEGMIERVEPRRGMLTRMSRRREHVLVANVDNAVIVMSLVEPDLKPHLIDRYLVAAEVGGLRPIICLNKCDLVELANLQSLVGQYCQLGIPTLLTSARDGTGIAALRQLLAGKASVFSGQSGVGKSSLLNALQPGLALRVGSISEVNQKGKHTTTASELIRLDFGGWVVDTPGIRQMQIWGIRPEEVEGYFPEFRPFVVHCDFPDCTHTHEKGCAIKQAVDRRQISVQRYSSYLGLFKGDDDEEN